MKWKGIRRDSLDVATDASQGLLGINSRFKVEGELRLRRGYARTSIVKKDYAITEIAAFSASQGVVSATLVDGDRWQGYSQPYALWQDNPTTVSYSFISSHTVVGLDAAELSLGTLDAGSYSLRYMSGAVLWGQAPDRYAATRADIIQVVGLQVWENAAWEWFSGTVDQALSAEDSEALAVGKVYDFTIASPQEIKLRFYDGGPSDNSGSVLIDLYSYTLETRL
jgi:hypothetical protein